MADRVARQRLTTLLLQSEDKELLEKIAREFGYTQTRGAGTGTLGSISALMRAIARGKIRLIPLKEEAADKGES